MLGATVSAAQYDMVLQGGRVIDPETARDGPGKMTLLPARRLETIAPVFRRKGRLQEGADADIAVFDPGAIIDRATYREPFQASEGVRYLLVNGRLVVRERAFLQDARPGRLLTSDRP